MIHFFPSSMYLKAIVFSILYHSFNSQIRTYGLRFLKIIWLFRIFLCIVFLVKIIVRSKWFKKSYLFGPYKIFLQVLQRQLHLSSVQKKNRQASTVVKEKGAIKPKRLFRCFLQWLKSYIQIIPLSFHQTY